jgi:predicted nucleotidyltransferase
MNADPTASPRADAVTDLEARLRGFFQSEHAAGVDSAYLFGGHAAGRAHRESDIDVAVLLSWEHHPDRRSRFDRRLRLAADLIGHLHRNDVDLLVLNDVPPLLGRRIIYEGIPLCRHDPEADHAYRRDVQLRAADLEPYLRRLRPLQLAALASR